MKIGKYRFEWNAWPMADNAFQAVVLTAFRQWEGLVSGDHAHLAACDDAHVFQITNPFRGRPLFWIRCEHAYMAQFQPTKTIRP